MTRGRRWVGVLTGLSLLACTSGPPPGSSLPIGDGPDVPDEEPEAGPPESPGQPPRRGKTKRRPELGDGPRGDRGKLGKRPHREPPPDTRPTPNPDRDRERAPAETPGIRFEGDDTWSVQRSKLDAIVGDPSRLGAAITKESNGYALSGVRDGSDAQALGAVNGDLVKRVNGKSLTSTVDLVQLWAELDSANSFRIEIDRGGSPRVHHYRID